MVSSASCGLDPTGAYLCQEDHTRSHPGVDSVSENQDNQTKRREQNLLQLEPLPVLILKWSSSAQ
jgi:hypothetical protein